MKCIIQAMELYSDDESLLLHCCTAITNLVHNSIDNRSRFLDAAGVDVLVASMDRHKENSKFQRQACWALLTVAGSDDASRMIIQGGAVSAIINAMVYHRHDSGVQQFGCWAMSNIALAGDDIKRKLRKGTSSLSSSSLSSSSSSSLSSSSLL